MVFFEKLAQFFKKQPAVASANGVKSAVQAPVSPDPVTKKAAPTTVPETLQEGTSLKDLFLQELRSIPVRHSTIESAREDLVKELKRLSPTDEGRPQ